MRIASMSFLVTSMAVLVVTGLWTPKVEVGAAIITALFAIIFGLWEIAGILKERM